MESQAEITGKRLTEIRKKHKYTQQYVADSIKISRSAYSQYEIGAREPKTETLIQIADLYHVAVDYLIGRY